jgi:hypothetical protein
MEKAAEMGGWQLTPYISAVKYAWMSTSFIHKLRLYGEMLK